MPDFRVSEKCTHLLYNSAPRIARSSAVAIRTSGLGNVVNEMRSNPNSIFLHEREILLQKFIRNLKTKIFVRVDCCQGNPILILNPELMDPLICESLSVMSLDFIEHFALSQKRELSRRIEIIAITSFS
jgi:hypothetical protein